MSDPQKIRQILPLYLVAGSQDCRHLAGEAAENLLKVLEAALQAGITCFQFRDKGVGSLADRPAEQAELAQRCRQLCQRYQVPFIVNDDLALAQAVNADGIHVGQGDISPKAIRTELGERLIIGLSVNKLAEARASDPLAEIDYFGIGPIFPTQSKADPKPVVGTAFIRQLRQAGIRKPLVAIGGVKANSVAELTAYGADGVAVISAITAAADVKAAVKALLAERQLAKEQAGKFGQENS